MFISAVLTIVRAVACKTVAVVGVTARRLSVQHDCMDGAEVVAGEAVLAVGIE